MPTIKKRLNLSLSSEMEKVLKMISKRDNVPHATKAVELMAIALELEEDQVWDSLAKERDTKKAEFVSHKKAWA